MSTVREILFKDMHGCSDHDCVIKPKQKGQMGTNGGCHCVLNMSRSQLIMLQTRIRNIADEEFK